MTYTPEALELIQTRDAEIEALRQRVAELEACTITHCEWYAKCNELIASQTREERTRELLREMGEWFTFYDGDMPRIAWVPDKVRSVLVKYKKFMEDVVEPNTELIRLSRIEDVAIEVVASEVWSGDEFYDKLCKLKDVLGE